MKITGKESEQIFLQRSYTNDLKAHEKMLSIISHHGKTSHNHNKVPLPIPRDGVIKKTDDNKCWQGCGEANPHNLFVRM